MYETRSVNFTSLVYRNGEGRLLAGTSDAALLGDEARVDSQSALNPAFRASSPFLQMSLNPGSKHDAYNSIAKLLLACA
jgi:hypothetical protein